MTYKKPDGERVLKTVRLLHLREEEGVTWYELGQEYGWHHGQSSAVLSSLHREGRISRLKEKRGKSSVYVESSYVGDRETVKPGVRHKSSGEAANQAYDDSIAAVAMVMRNSRRTLQPHNKTCWRDHPYCALDVAIKQIQRLKS